MGASANWKDGRALWMAGGGLAEQPVFPVVCFGTRYGVKLPFVGDYAGGNRSLARVCFYRLKTAAFYLATSRSHAGRLPPTTCHDKEPYPGTGHCTRERRGATRTRRRLEVLAWPADDGPSRLATTRKYPRVQPRRGGKPLRHHRSDRRV